MTKRENEMGGYSVDELARGVAEDTLPRSKALKAGFAALLGGLVGSVALPRSAEAAVPPVFWAVVDFEGNLERGRGAVRARRVSEGQYLVTFKEDVSGGAYSATLSELSNARISVEERGFINPKQVQVWTFSSSETPADMRFSLVVHR